MSVSRTKYLTLNRDPEKVARLKTVLDKAFDRLVDRIEDLASADVATPYKVDPSSRTAGKDFLEQHSKMSNARASRWREMGEAMRQCELIMNLTIIPQDHAHATQEAKEFEQEEEQARELLNASFGNATADRIRELREKYGPAFKLPNVPDEEDGE